MSPSNVVRAELFRLLEQELLGPRGGPDEEITGTPRAAYLIGGLAPVTVDPALPVQVQAEGDGENPNETGAAITDIDPDTFGQRGVPVVSDEDVREVEDEADHDDGPKGNLTHPSSMGLRFQIAAGEGPLVVTASWGRYEGFRKERHDGRMLQWSKRIPFEKAETLDVGATARHTTFRRDIDDDVSLIVEVFPRGDRLIVELALSNDRETGMDAPPKDWLFQTKLKVTADDGSAVFLPTRDVLLPDYDETDPERRRLDLQYRHRLEFAIGRTTSVTWTEGSDRRATSVETTWLPTAEVPQTVAGTAGAAILSMRELAELKAAGAATALIPLVDGYETWLDEQEAAAATLPEHLAEIAQESIAEARLIASRLRDGIALLASDEQTLVAFRFMNRAMRTQRIRSQVAMKRSSGADVSVATALAEVEAEGDKAASWRPFQLAFILLQLSALTDPTHPTRSGGVANVELLFFPTGGGKTEAYLGLAAFTFAIRRLQGKLESDEGILDGADGVAVLMRYTLRLLTSQQFQRAAALVCATELIRQEDPATWGEKPFSIGLWVGSAVSPKRFQEARDQVRIARSDDREGAFGLTVLQLRRCPWCGTPIDPKRDVHVIDTEERIVVFCGDRTGSCPFSEDGDGDEGLPITTVDDEIYQRPPTFLLATVDKFARLAREGEAASLFGYVREWCPRHGYRHPDSHGSCSGQSHKAKTAGGVTYPSVQLQQVDRLRPPDLIIQDELHLITGSLGTAVGVFESAVDLLSSYDNGGTTVRPLLVASTATVRNAENQVRALYARGVDVFPPQVLDVRDTYFSRELEVTEDDPGRRYVGVCAHGIRLTLAEIRMSEVLLLAGQKLLDDHGDAADPYLTTVGYFSATRELAGMRRYLDDDVTTRVAGNTVPFPRRTTDWSRLEIGELTARISSEEIATTLDKLSLQFNASRWSTQGKAAFSAAFADAMKNRRPVPDWGERPYDFVLATSMLQVGVDVPRLGLMLVVGQPKNTAEYIQASSRVGRDASRPGLVVSLHNWSRPRDLAHFEQFRHYHETFYAQLEALSVTPFSETAMERGLMGVLVSVARIADAPVPGSLSPGAGARQIDLRHAAVEALIDKLVARNVRAVGQAERERYRGLLVQRMDRWLEKSGEWQGALVYERKTKPDIAEGILLKNPESSTISPSERVFVVANSMREVQPEINLIVSPGRNDRLAFREPPGSPQWDVPKGEE